MDRRSSAAFALRALRSRWLLPAISVALFAGQVAFAVHRGDELTFYDEADNPAIARSLAAGGGFATAAGPTAFRAPGTPLWLALAYSFFGSSVFVGRVAQALLLACLPALTAWVARPILKHPGRSNLVGIACALHPGLLYAGTTLYPVALASVGLLLGVGLTSRTCRSGGAWRAAAAGLALGVAALATPYLAPMGVAAALLVGTKQRLACAAILAATSLLPTGAWIARNDITMGAPVLATHGGYNLAVGANARATIWSGNTIEPDLARADAPDDEVARDAAYRDTATRWIRAHPRRWLELAVGRGVAVFTPTGAGASAGPTHRWVGPVATAFLALWVAAGLAGLWVGRRSVEARLAFVALALVAASAATTIAKPRFRFPCDPLLAPFAMVLGLRVRARLTASRRGDSTATFSWSQPTTTASSSSSSSPGTSARE